MLQFIKIIYTFAKNDIMLPRSCLRKALYWIHTIQRHTLFTPLSSTIKVHAGEFPTYEFSLIDNGEVVAHCSVSQGDENMDKFNSELLTIYATLPKYGIKLQ